MEKKPKLASVADKIRGCIAIALTISCRTYGANATDQRWQAVAMIAGLLYFVTSLAIVFKDVD